MMQEGSTDRLGAWLEDDGINFALYAGAAEAVELCLYDASRQEVARHFLPGQKEGVWHGFLPGGSAGQRYGYRVHGPWAPDLGLRHNAAKLLIDPYTRRLDGDFHWNPAVYDFIQDPGEEDWQKSDLDSAPYIPLSTVNQARERKGSSSAWVPWAEMVLYEANVRGYTMRHPGLTESERGKFTGLKNGQVLDYLKALGITSVELMPVHAMIDEAFLVDKGLRNLWGYNSVQFFTPDGRFGVVDPVAEFREMAEAIHEAGLEVILDVVYNHTGEGSEHGPTLSFRGIDSQAYYRHEPVNPDRYINDTGCGNTINADHPRVQDLVLNSLVYWHREMGVDGFRFDLATVLGRTGHGFSRNHPLLTRMSIEPELYRAKLIAEPWDPGPGGYQLGQFPIEWAELNDRYRDTARRYWRGDAGQSSEFARRIHGSADLFERSGRDSVASVNLVSSHDGFTLYDTVSYENRNNQANQENNRDGHAHNFSCNYGAEGETDDAAINALRRQQRLNLLATLLFSQGTPMILAGDEFGNSQGGNNNAYAQDNETGWVDWRGLEEDPDFTEKVRQLIRLRRNLPLLRQPRYVHGRMPTDQGFCDITWLHSDGRPMEESDWSDGQQVALFFTCHEEQHEYSPVMHAIAILYNASPEETEFRLPVGLIAEWELRFYSCGQTSLERSTGSVSLPGRSMALATMGLDV
ncbi:glycogen debranching protein GlgX [Pseudomonadota bacterium]